MYIDTHSHLCDEIYDALIKTMHDDFLHDNLEFVINASSNLLTSRKNVEYASVFSGMYALVGLHPDSEKELSEDTLSELKQLSKNKKVVGIGEIGLDYHYAGYSKEGQAKAFIAQIKLAHELELPVVVHIRDAYEDAFDIMKQHKNFLKSGILLHCYSGSAEFMKRCINEFENIYFAFGGVITFKNARALLESVYECPIERILTETDCPYLTPEPFRGQMKNEPKLIKYVYKKISEIKGIGESVLEKQIKENVFKLFPQLKAHRS